MSRFHRSIVALLLASVVIAALIGAWGSVPRIDAQAGDELVADALPVILVGQKPRLTSFFAGNDATFTVGITNTGTVTLQSVVVANATTTSCNRSNLGPLEPGQSASYTCTREDVTTSFMNDLEAIGTAEGGVTDSHQSNAYVNVLNPDLRISKRREFQNVQPGATAVFTIVVFNSSPDRILTDIRVDDSAVDDCDLDPIVPVNLASGDSFDYSCQQPNVQGPITSIVTVEATDPISGDTVTATNAAWVDVLDLDAAMTPEPTAVAEPGAPVTFHVNLVNVGSAPVTLTGLTTNQFGSILDPGNDQVDPAHNTCLPQPTLPTIQPYGGNYTCSFTAAVTGQPSNFSVILTATARDRNSQTLTATTNSTVQITNVPAAISLSASANPSFVHPPGSSVTFSVRVDNIGEADAVTLTELRDQFIGNLDGRGTCDLPVVIQPGFSYQCQFSANVSGQTGEQKSRTITVTAQDDDLSSGTVTDSATVTVSITDLPTQFAFMPSVVDSIVGSGCVDAFPLALNRQYSFLPPAQGAQSVFRFTLPNSGSVRVEMTNFVPRAGQLVVWAGQCGSLELAGRNPDTALNKMVDLGTRPAGQYIIQIINDGPTNMTDPYRLRITFN